MDFLDLAKIPYPKEYQGKTTLPLDGQSLLPIFRGETRPETPFVVSGNTERFRMYREGKWKIVRENAEEWELYNMEADKTELNNLAESHAEKLAELVANYEAYRASRE